MRKLTAETKLKKELTNTLDKMGIRWFRMQSGTLKKGNRYIKMNKAGTPDLLIIRNGKALWIEIKKKGEKPTEAQVTFMHEAVRHGEQHLVCDSLDGMILGLQMSVL